MGKGDVPTKRPCVLQAEVQTVPTLVENKKAQLVVSAQMWTLLCLKVGVSYCIIKVKPRLGHIVHSKIYTSITFTQGNSEDNGVLAKQLEATISGPISLTDTRGSPSLGEALSWV